MTIENHKKKKKLILKKHFVVLFLLFFIFLSLFSSYNIIRWAIDAKNTEKQIEEIHEIVEIKEITDSTETEIVNPSKEEVKKENPYWDYIKMNLINVDFTNLKEKNNEIVGWIQVSGTNINYPFVQTDNNTYYLKKDFNKKYNSAGWVFMDYRNDLKTLNQNTILYAHGRIDGTMFGSLKNIFKSNWYNNKNNHVVKLSTEYQNTMWQVFSVYRIPETSDYLEINFNDNEKYVNFLNMLQDRSELKFDVSLNEEDKILTLSTCYKENDRVVLHAKLIKMEARNGNN
jgi:sortase B